MNALPEGITAEELRDDFRLACISRAIDDREINLQKQSRVFFQISGAGHEALGTALARSLRVGVDWLFPYYRDQALMLGLGASAYELLLQAVGAADDPASGGRQMPAHWGSVARNVATTSSPTGSQCLPGVGCAEAGRYLARRPHLGRAAGDELTVVSLGEGACSEGEFWESLNSACTLHLPVLYVVANNGFAISVPEVDQHPAPVHEMVRGFRGLHIELLDGCDYLAARATFRRVTAMVRAGVGPALVEARVTRPYSHSAADTQAKYRTPGELATEAANDPIEQMAALLVDTGTASTEEVAAIRAAARDEVAAATDAALARPAPDPTTVLHHVVALPQLDDPAPLNADESEETVAFGDGIRRALHELMAADERIRVFGEDVADAREALLAELEGKGGVFGTTHGLQKAFGSARVFNAPLAEANIVGRAVGQALRGLKPIPEVQFFDYVWPAMQQIRSEAATIRWRSNGAFTCPMVLRIAIGGYLTGGAIWHSQCGESIFTHVPGLLVAFPSRTSDAVGLLRTAVQRCDDPVLFLEHKHLLRQPYARTPYPPPEWLVPFGRLARRRDGDRCTVVTWGATVQRSIEAADQVAATTGAEVEVVDLRTLAPWDRSGVGDAVARTRRLVVVHEDTLTSGFGAEVAAWVGQHCFDVLDAPVGRVGALDAHVGYAPVLEAAVLPQVSHIATAISEALAW